MKTGDRSDGFPQLRFRNVAALSKSEKKTISLHRRSIFHIARRTFRSASESIVAVDSSLWMTAVLKVFMSVIGCFQRVMAGEERVGSRRNASSFGGLWKALSVRRWRAVVSLY